MRASFRVLALAVPLLVVACKKKEVEEPVSRPAPPPAPSLVWRLGPVQLVGSDDGTITIPVRVQNDSGKALVVKSHNVGIHTDGGRVCVVSGDEVRISEGDELSFQLRGSCNVSRVPAGNDVRLVGSFEYSNGDETRKYDVDQEVSINR